MQENRDSFLGGGRWRAGGYMWSIPTPGLSTDGGHCDVDLSSISEQGLMMNWKDAAVKSHLCVSLVPLAGQVL